MVGHMSSFSKFAAGLALVVAAAGSIAPAQASDAKWGGLYIGASAGWVGSDISWKYAGLPGDDLQRDNPSTSSGLLGGFVGIQHQFNHFVVGVEASYSGMNAFRGNDFDGGACANNATFRCLGRTHSLFTVGPRVGYAPNEHWLLFATGGYANGRIETQTRDTLFGDAVFDQSSSRHGGWFVGAGVEYAITSNLILGLEYQHVELEGRNIRATPFFTTEVRNDLGADMDIVRARLSFKLGRPESKDEDSLK